MRLIWGVMWSALLLVVCVWWRESPGGFAVSHPRFWTNDAIPLGVAGLALTGLLASFRATPWLLAPLSLFFVAAGASTSLVAIALFPLSVGSFGLFGLGAAALFGILSALTWRQQAGSALLAVFVVAVSVTIGVVMAMAQQAGPPGTVPLDLPFPLAGVPCEQKGPSLSLSEGVEVLPADGRVCVSCADLRFSILPLLTFYNRSPDRCWPRLTASSLERPPTRKLRSVNLDRRLPLAQMWYRDEAASLLQVQSRGDAVEIEAYTRVEQPVYTVENHWCAFTIRGHRELFFAFSPCPDARIAVMPYVKERPLRLAYVDGENVFRVVEAAEADRGPFRELAVGRLSRQEALAITVYDGERLICRLVFDDWATQACRSVSPTAGWGLPVNAIIFDRLGEAPTSAGSVWICLASTFVGAGWDSVGHRAGTYRNRMRIEPMLSAAATPFR